MTLQFNYDNSFSSSSYPNHNQKVYTTWTISDIEDLSGKVAIVTGGSSGIGYFICLELARKGAKVYLACRDEGRAREAIKSIRSKIFSSSTSQSQSKSSRLVELDFIQFDLTRLRSCKDAAESFKSKESRLDILINNATVNSTIPYTITEDGIEIQSCTAIGHFCLTMHLLPILKKTVQLGEDQGKMKQENEKTVMGKDSKNNGENCSRVVEVDLKIQEEKLEKSKGNDGGKKENDKVKNQVRVVNITSIAHKFNSEPNFENLKNLNQKRCSSLGRYGNSMLSIILFTKELQNQLLGTGILCLAVHPGILSDRLFQDNKKLRAIMMVLFLRTKESLLMETQEAAFTPLYAATSNELEKKNLGGSYLVPPGKPAKPHPNARDKNGELTRQFWKLCEDLVFNPDRLNRRMINTPNNSNHKNINNNHQRSLRTNDYSNNNNNQNENNDDGGGGGSLGQEKKKNNGNKNSKKNDDSCNKSKRRRSKRLSGGVIVGSSNNKSHKNIFKNYMRGRLN